MWTRERLQSFVRQRLDGVRLICVANREPYIHVRGAAGIQLMEPASGVVTALDPVMRAAGGVWVAHGSGSADLETVDARDRVWVPPRDPQYLLRRVWLSQKEEQGYYYGFANEALWPLCHIAYHRPVFRESDWREYVAVNEKFANAIIEEAADAERVIVFVQDYHFALVPKLVKQRLPSAIVAQFWHIPWPNAEAFRICPWKQEILEGMLGNDLLAFHIQHHCNNFLETVDREIESRIDREHFSVTLRGSPTLVRPHAISVDFEELSREADTYPTARRIANFRQEHRLEDVKIVLGVDRTDYTKGIPERLRAIDSLLRRHPDLAGRFVHVQIGVPSRTHIPAYQSLRDEIVALVEEINVRHRTPAWQPLLYLDRHFDRETLIALYRTADVCAVTSLHDGMNLVAKEFVASRPDGRGVLVLSHFTGAARELTHALLVNPYAVDEMAETLNVALLMPAEKQAVHMEKLRTIVREHNVFRWVGKVLADAVRVEVTA